MEFQLEEINKLLGPGTKTTGISGFWWQLDPGNSNDLVYELYVFDEINRAGFAQSSCGIEILDAYVPCVKIVCKEDWISFHDKWDDKLQKMPTSMYLRVKPRLYFSVNFCHDPENEKTSDLGQNRTE